jgi:hypothetical protein
VQLIGYRQIGKTPIRAGFNCGLAGAKGYRCAKQQTKLFHLYSFKDGSVLVKITDNEDLILKSAKLQPGINLIVTNIKKPRNAGPVLQP